MPPRRRRVMSARFTRRPLPGGRAAALDPAHIPAFDPTVNLKCRVRFRVPCPTKTYCETNQSAAASTGCPWARGTESGTCRLRPIGGVAQWIEQEPSKLKVAGSIPAAPAPSLRLNHAPAESGHPLPRAGVRPRSDSRMLEPEHLRIPPPHWSVHLPMRPFTKHRDDLGMNAQATRPRVPTYCIACGAQLPDRATYCPGCGMAVDATPPSASPPVERPHIYAPLGRRWLAWLIDWVILVSTAAAIVVISWWALAPTNGTAAERNATGDALGFGLGFLFMSLGPLYPALLHRYWHGQTLGKRAAGVRVVNYDGTPLRTGQCLGRSYLRLGFWAMMWIGWFVDSAWPLFQPERRALHDLATGTIVVPAENHSSGRRT